MAKLFVPLAVVLMFGVVSVNARFMRKSLGYSITEVSFSLEAIVNFEEGIYGQIRWKSCQEQFLINIQVSLSKDTGSL